MVRALVAGAGELWAALIFAGLLAGLILVDQPCPRDVGARWRALPSLAAGLTFGLVLALPSVVHPDLAGRGVNGFVPWALVAGAVATLEEVVIRGRLQPVVAAELGVIPSLLVSAAIFALIHLPRYGLAAMPLDAAVGLALAGLRAVSGRVLPSVVAHVAADWAAWFTA